MAHYALLDENNIVVQVITGKDETETEPDGTVVDWEIRYSELTGFKVKRTSYNTNGNVHYFGGIPFRKNYAQIGSSYDEQRDAFIFLKPFASWVLDEDTCLWEAPTAKPNDNKVYTWDEPTLSWIEVVPPTE